ncbi:preQ(1) synthase [Natranaerofaba carboxydovora]|uniref:preQ(1) synthase n=1 Tax=Natranaerofaba carboxydovora TaxID=2742683 RepID=UPI001F129152|nr:preQ(1) synthase [Natranaerofaba carboxydovora]UMZ73858.1 NADPH-dependent 7-cyano-7-deazaguanine reductase [Natranaerofaba carboxydovora]
MNDNEKKYEDRRFDTATKEDVDVEILEAIDYDYPGKKTEVEFVYPEFTSVCPWTGLPDFGTLTIKFVPKEKLVELKSLKYYLHSYRDVGILQEHVVNEILNHLVDLIEPLSMEVTGDFYPRGGIKTVAKAKFP